MTLQRKITRSVGKNLSFYLTGSVLPCDPADAKGQWMVCPSCCAGVPLWRNVHGIADFLYEFN